MNRQVPILDSILLRMVFRHIPGLDMNDIVATREWINHKMEARGESVEIDCNMTMREIFDVMDWPYPSRFVGDMFEEIFPGQPHLGFCLHFDIKRSLDVS